MLAKGGRFCPLYCVCGELLLSLLVGVPVCGNLFLRGEVAGSFRALQPNRTGLNMWRRHVDVARRVDQRVEKKRRRYVRLFEMMKWYFSSGTHSSNFMKRRRYLSCSSVHSACQSWSQFAPPPTPSFCIASPLTPSSSFSDTVNKLKKTSI